MALCGYRILLMANCAILAAAAGAGRRAPAPLLFLANHGQAPPPFRFMARAPGLTAYFRSDGELRNSGRGRRCGTKSTGAAALSGEPWTGAAAVPLYGEGARVDGVFQIGWRIAQFWPRPQVRDEEHRRRCSFWRTMDRRRRRSALWRGRPG